MKKTNLFRSLLLMVMVLVASTVCAQGKVPEAWVMEYTGADKPAGLEKAYSFYAYDPDAADADAAIEALKVQYADQLNMHVDFVITFDKDVPAGSVAFYGNYGDYGWQEVKSDEVIPANTPIRVMGLMGMTLTYEDLLKFVKVFHCGAMNLDDANKDTKMTVALNMYNVDENGDEIGEPVKIEDVSYTLPEAAVVYPEAWVVEYKGADKPAGLEKAYSFYAYDPEAADADAAIAAMKEKYASALNMHADFVITFDKDVPAGSVAFYGNYGDYGWQEVKSDEVIPANTPIRVMELMGLTITYEDLLKFVKVFHCGAMNLDDANKDTKMTVALNIYNVDENGDEVGEPVAIEDVVYELPEAAVVYPEAWVKEYTGADKPAGLEKAYSFYAYDPEAADVEAAIAEMKEKYASALKMHADFEITFDKDVPAGSVAFYGNYGDYGWQEVKSSEMIPANTPIRIMNLMNLTLTYEDLLKFVKVFHCGAMNLDDANKDTKMTVTLNMYNVDENGDETGEPVKIEDVNYTLPEAAVVYPEAWVKEYTGADKPAGLEKAYSFYAYNPEAADADAAIAEMMEKYASALKMHADFEITFDKDVPAGSVAFYGNYGDYGWQTVKSDEVIPANTPIRIMNLMNLTLTYEDLLKFVKVFHCGAMNLDDANKDTKMTVTLNMYNVDENGEETGEPVAIEDVVYELPEAAVVYPEAWVVEYAGADKPAGLEKAYSFYAYDPEAADVEAAIAEMKEKYASALKMHADFEITFDKDVPAGSVAFYGNYGDYGWQTVKSDEVIRANTPIRVMDLYGAKVTYADMLDFVKVFHCGAMNLDDANKDTKMTVALNIYNVDENGDETGEPVAIKDVEYTLPESVITLDVYQAGKDKLELQTLAEFKAIQTANPNAMAVVAEQYAEAVKDEANILYESASGYVCPNFVLDDNYDWTAPADFTAISGSYKRNLVAVNSVCMPFAVGTENIPEGAELLKYKTMNDETSTAIFDEVDAIEAGVPCVLFSNGAANWEVSFSNTPIVTSVNNGTLKGSYETQALGEGYYKLSSGKFVKTTASSHVYPFRMYLDLGNSAVKAFTLSFGGETAIAGIELNQNAGAIYSIDGVQQSASKKGINIVRMKDGSVKKFIVK